MYEVRAATEMDLPLIRDAWQRSAASGFAYRRMPRATYEAAITTLIDDVLARSVVLVVADKARPEKMIGWSVSEYPDDSTVVVHYVYVRHNDRRKRVGTALARAMGLHDTARVIYSHNNTSAWHICPARGWQYNPFLLWRPTDVAR